MLDSIKWGNPTRDVLPLLKTISPLDIHFKKLSQYQFPLNSSKGCREELNLLVDYTQSAFNDSTYYENLKAFSLPINNFFYNIIDTEGLGEKNNTVHDTVDCIIEETFPLILKLKYHFQRIRPTQLAIMYKMGLFPYHTIVDTPSFPCRYALQAKLICFVLGNMFPDTMDYFDKLSYEMSQSRLYMGINYPSDVDASVLMADEILQDEEFKKRYGLIPII